ncbi:uncharacterized protein LOC130495628 [Raphanus sativus]|uniref:Uncharacterized protein LOC130495628 n=1 Tax=Raphanus sativus TaxID=3726 RepID=A0A9W3BV18_RAPSA|nr:uncharacterized protein LOC130495628 [Raphanus sativus]
MKKQKRKRKVTMKNCRRIRKVTMKDCRRKTKGTMKNCRRIREYCDIVQDCIERNMTKEDTMRFVQNEYLIPLQDTNRVWNRLQSTNPDLFIAYNARIRERDARIRERNARIPPPVAQPSPQEVTSARRRKPLGTKPEHRLSPPPPTSRTLLPDLNVPVASPQEDAAYANANAIENQKIQAPQQQPVYPNNFWQRVMNTLGQIQSNTQHLDTLGQIHSNTEQLVKLVTDVHGFGPYPSTAGSLKRQRAEEAEERGKKEEEEKQQKKDEGNGEEVQEKEEGSDEELQKNEGCGTV